MKTHDVSAQGPQHHPGDDDRDDLLESLLGHATARQRAPAQDERRVRDSLHRQWLDMTLRRRRLRSGFAAGLAASILLAAVVGIIRLDRQAPDGPLVQLATVDKQSGNVYTHPVAEPASSRRLASGALFAGQAIATARNARVAFTWSSGESVRVDQNTRLTLVSATAIQLLEGRIYFDSGRAGEARGALQFRTPAGTVRHLGTQFMAGVSGSTLTLSVREGKVTVGGDGPASTATPGEQIQVTAGGAQTRQPIRTYGALWAWTEALTPGFSLDGHSAHEFIDWVSRETGRKASYASAAAERLARQTTLHGSIDLEPMRALELILQTSDLVPVIRNGEILIRVRQGG